MKLLYSNYYQAKSSNATEGDTLCNNGKLNSVYQYYREHINTHDRSNGRSMLIVTCIFCAVLLGCTVFVLQYIYIAKIPFLQNTQCFVQNLAQLPTPILLIIKIKNYILIVIIKVCVFLASLHAMECIQIVYMVQFNVFCMCLSFMLKIKLRMLNSDTVTLPVTPYYSKCHPYMQWKSWLIRFKLYTDYHNYM